MFLGMLPHTLHRRLLEKKLKLDAKRPLPKSIVRRIEESMQVEFVYSTNKIEGSTLTRGETGMILRGMTVHGKNILDVIAAENHPKTLKFVRKLATDVERKISEEDIKEIHELTMERILPNAGQYRQSDVAVHGDGFQPPPFYEVQKNMVELIALINKNEYELRTVELAAHAHYYLAWLHPFDDGNGRVARLLMNMILFKHGYPLTPIRSVDRKKYLDALKRADNGDFQPFLLYIARCVEQMLDLYLIEIEGRGRPKQKLMPLSKAAKGTPYSAEYLSLLARRGLLDAVKVGRAWMTTRRTVKRYIEEHGRK